MVGYGLALIVDKLTGATLSEMQGSFLGLLSLHIVVFGVLLFPTLDRVQVQSSSHRVHLLSGHVTMTNLWQMWHGTAIGCPFHLHVLH